MTKKSTGAATAAGGAKFVGGYVAEMAYVLAASAISGQHAIILGGAGWGKTDITTAGAKAIAGQGRYSYAKLEPSTPPEVIKGVFDPAALLNEKIAPRERMARIVDGTPYDPSARIALLDEVFRANDVVFDALLDTLDRRDKSADEAATCWATANFVAEGERVQALVDRFGLWNWVRPEALDAAQLVTAQLQGIGGGLSVDYPFPAWQDVESARKATPSAGTIAQVADILGELSAASATKGLQLHPRRLAQMAKMVARLGMYYAGAADCQIDERATRILKYAYPAPTESAAGAWAEIAESIVDAAGARIAVVMEQAYGKFLEISKLGSQAERQAKQMELARFLASTHSDLKQVGGNDPRVAEAITITKMWMQAAIRGEKPNKADKVN